MPDTAGLNATRSMLKMVSGLGPEDLVLCLISGGASSLMTLPADGIDLHAKQSVTKALLRSGASIHEINCVRKHLSCVKGGRLAIAAAPAPVVTLMISDVPGDDPAVIGSGPTVPDPTSLADARAVIERYKIAVPASMLSALRDPIMETPKPGDPHLSRRDPSL